MRPNQFAIFVVGLLGALNALWAQEQPPVQPVVPAPAFKPLASLLNVPVFVASPSAAEQKDKEDLEDTQGDKRDGVGLLSNLVIDTLTHRITFAAVQTEDVARAVPFMSLTWDPSGRGWLLADGKEVLAKAKPFEPSRLDELHGAVADASAKNERGTEGVVRDAERGVAEASRTTTASSNRYMLATECAKREVVAEDGSFGTGVGMVIETNSGSPAFLRVAATGGDVAIPFAALKGRKAIPSGEGEAFSVAMKKVRIETAPRLDREPKANLDDRDFRVRLYEFFGIVTPAFDNSNPLRKY